MIAFRISSKHTAAKSRGGHGYPYLNGEDSGLAEARPSLCT